MSKIRDTAFEIWGEASYTMEPADIYQALAKSVVERVVAFEIVPKLSQGDYEALDHYVDDAEDFAEDIVTVAICQGLTGSTDAWTSVAYQVGREAQVADALAEPGDRYKRFDELVAALAYFDMNPEED